MHWISPFVGCEMGKFKAVLRKMPVFFAKKSQKIWWFQKNVVPLHSLTGCSAVGSARVWGA